MPAYTVKTMQGLEEVLAGEIEAIGGTNIQKHTRAVSFEGPPAMLYKANLHLRTALKVLQPIAEFRAVTPRALYEGVRNIEWSRYLKTDGTLAVESAVHSPFFTHSQYAALTCKDAIVDQFREAYGRRPSVDLNHPDLRIHVHIWQDQVGISLDSSGESLHKRGYKQDINVSPLNEVLAAGMIMLTGWRGESPFCDPMCGSGTLLIEAALIATQTPPGLFRSRYGFMQWPDFDSTLWSSCVEEAKHQIREEPENPIAGADLSTGTRDAAAANIVRAGVDEYISLKVADIRDFMPPAGEGMCIVNPPYGERFTHSALYELYEAIGSAWKHRFPSYTAWMLSSNSEALKHVGLRPFRKIKLLNASLECTYAGYKLYAGSKKEKNQQGNNA
jgi:putative N6-adenine-specific DNA methylase